MGEILQWAAVLVLPLSLAMGWLWSSLVSLRSQVAALQEWREAQPPPSEVASALGRIEERLGHVPTEGATRELAAKLEYVGRMVDRHERHLWDEREKP